MSDQKTVSVKLEYSFYIRFRKLLKEKNLNMSSFIRKKIRDFVDSGGEK